MDVQCLTVRAVIPHYYFESGAPVRGVGAGFGSRHPGSRLARSIAFSRCLHGLLNLRRSKEDLQLDLRTAQGVATPLGVEPLDLKLEVVVAIHKNACLMDVVTPLFPQVRVLQHELDDPRKLGLAARDWLIQHPSPADLNLYLEDDLVIQDPLFADKILWMAQRSNQKCVLLPHRYELTRRIDLPSRLFIDGSIHQHELIDWHKPSVGIAKGNFRDQKGIQFDCPSNPHSGCFGISRSQLKILRDRKLPCDGFVGPLETAATYTVGCEFVLLKPSLANRNFLMIEHGHPSYLGYLKHHS